MADAKKGDSFMRHNITKKVISAMLSGVLMLSLAGCGKAAKLPETVVNTSLVVEKNGKVVSYLVNTFDKDFYSLDGLTQMVQEEAEEFNAAHGDAAEPPMAVKTVQMLEEGDTLKDITLPNGALVMIVKRGTEFLIPNGSLKLHLGDKLLLISDKKSSD